MKFDKQHYNSLKECIKAKVDAHTLKQMSGKYRDEGKSIERFVWDVFWLSNLSKNEMIDSNTKEVRKMNENELFLKPTWIINNLMAQTNQYELIINNTKLLNFNL